MRFRFAHRIFWEIDTDSSCANPPISVIIISSEMFAVSIFSFSKSTVIPSDFSSRRTVRHSLVLRNDLLILLWYDQFYLCGSLWASAETPHVYPYKFRLYLHQRIPKSMFPFYYQQGNFHSTASVSWTSSTDQRNQNWLCNMLQPEFSVPVSL